MAVKAIEEAERIGLVTPSQATVLREVNELTSTAKHRNLGRDTLAASIVRLPRSRKRHQGKTQQFIRLAGTIVFTATNDAKLAQTVTDALNRHFGFGDFAVHTGGDILLEQGANDTGRDTLVMDASDGSSTDENDNIDLEDETSGVATSTVNGSASGSATKVLTGITVTAA